MVDTQRVRLGPNAVIGNRAGPGEVVDLPAPLANRLANWGKATLVDADDAPEERPSPVANLRRANEPTEADDAPAQDLVADGLDAGVLRHRHDGAVMFKQYKVGDSEDDARDALSEDTAMAKAITEALNESPEEA